MAPFLIEAILLSGLYMGIRRLFQMKTDGDEIENFKLAFLPNSKTTRKTQNNCKQRDGGKISFCRS